VGSVLILSHHVGSVSSRQGDMLRSPSILYPLALCYVMLHATVLSHRVMLHLYGYCMFFYFFHIKPWSLQGHTLPLDRMLRYWLYNLNRESRTFARNKTLKRNVNAFILHCHHISPIWGADPFGPISTKIGTLVGVHDVIIHSKFGFNILKGFRSTGGQNFRFPIDFAGHRYNSAATTAKPLLVRKRRSFMAWVVLSCFSGCYWLCR